MSDGEEDVQMMTPAADEEDEPMNGAGGSDDDDEQSTPASAASAKGKKGAAGKGKGGKKESPAKSSTKGGKKASPNKRKEAPAAADDKPAKKTKATGAPAAPSGSPKDVLRTYMKQQNRPYTALVIYENLHHTIKKPAVVALCEELVTDGDLQVKDFKKVRMYMAKQLDSDAVSPEELDALTQRETSVKERLADQKAANAKIDLQIRQLQNEPSDEELAKQLKEYAKTIDTLNAKLARFKTDKNPVTKEGMNKAQVRFNEMCKQWRIRKRAAEDMIDGMCGDDGDPKEVRERFRIETDDDAGDSLAAWKDLVKEVKK